jgi:hypothetical protein
MRLFDELAIETQSTCNRHCPTCLRQSWPDKTVLVGRLNVNRMPEKLVMRLIDDAAQVGFRGRVCLQHFNEPLQDDRFPALARYAKNKGCFKEVYANTNADLLTLQLAEQLDGAVDRLHIALYGPRKLQRSIEYRSWFKKTALTWTGGEHIITHFSPFSNTNKAIIECYDQPCERECQMRMIIAYTGEMLMCCDDIAGSFSLGNVNELSLEQLWFGNLHTTLVQRLSCKDGRHDFPLCRICPRPNTPYWSSIGGAK